MLVLRLRFLGLRLEKVKEKCWFPNRRPRHARCDLKEIVRKAEEDYVDFQEARLGREQWYSSVRVSSMNEVWPARQAHNNLTGLDLIT